MMQGEGSPGCGALCDVLMYLQGLEHDALAVGAQVNWPIGCYAYDSPRQFSPGGGACIPEQAGG